MPRLSAIIATRDRRALLEDCLATLGVQDVPPGTLEVVVVDDGSSETLEPVVAGAASDRVEMRLVVQDPAGANPARNRGAAEARSDLLAYLDDDTLVAPGWAAAVIRAFSETGCDALAGRVELQFEVAPPNWLDDRKLRRFLSEFDLGPRRVDLPRTLTPVSANCAVSLRAFEAQGGFDVSLGRVGGSLLSNDEVGFFRGIVERGGRTVYEPGAHVMHRVPPARMDTAWFRRRVYAQGVSDVLLDGAAGHRGLTPLLREEARRLRVVPITGANLLRGKGAVNAELWLAYCRGRLDALRGRIEPL